MSTCVIVNPKAGKADQMGSALERLALRFGATICTTRGPEDAPKLAAEAVQQGCELIVAAGGDGTASGVVNGIMNAGGGESTTLAIIPLGTGNDFPRTLELPDDPLESIELLESAKRHRIDLIRVRFEGRTIFGCNAAAGGFTGQMNEAITDQVKQTWGPLAYLRGALKVLPDLTRYHTTIRLDGKPPTQIPALNIIVANGRTAGGGIVVAPQANLQDGLLDIVTVRPGTLMELSGVAARLLAGDYTASDIVTHERAHRAEIESEPGMWFNLDGELITNRRIVFSVVPSALRVITGPEYRLEAS